MVDSPTAGAVGDDIDPDCLDWSGDCLYMVFRWCKDIFPGIIAVLGRARVRNVHLVGLRVGIRGGADADAEEVD